MGVPDTDASPSQDTRFGKYQLIASLGHGGMADVFLSVVHGPVGFNKLQVVKRLRPNLAEEPEFLTMFLDEARLAARLNHSNVVQTNEVGEVAGQFFIAMEYLDGQPLNRVIHRANKTKSLPLPLAIKVVIDALSGLHYAHELADYDGTPLGVVHRDASPHNIFVTYDGQAKVVDFGIAKAATRSADTRTGVLKGKIAYMSPEQARCESVDRRADIFAIGVLLWELVAGIRMWKGMSDMEILDRLFNGRVPSLRDVRPDAPEELERIISRALAPTAEGRYETAADLRSDLNAYVEKEGQRCNAEDIGRLVSTLFADKRQELKRIIERQLSGLKAGNPDISVVDMNTLVASGSSLPRVASASNPPPTDGTPSNQNLVTPSGAFPSSQDASATGMRAKSGAWIAIGIGAIAAVALFVLLRARGEPVPAAAPARGVDSGAVATTAEPQHVSVELKVHATPDQARIFLDDAPLATNPFLGKFAPDGQGHRVRVEAPGFVTQTKMAVFEHDVALDIKLDPEPSAKPDKHVEPPPAVVGPTPQGPGKPTKRKLDPNDPWK